MKNALLFISIIMLGASSLISQNKNMSPLDKMYEAYLTGKRSLWEESIRDLKEDFRASANTDGRVLYELVLAQHGLIGAMYVEKDGDAIYKVLDEAERNATKLLKFPQYKSQGYSFLGAILSIRVGLNTMKAIYLGSKIEQNYKDAARVDPENPSLWVEKGHLKFHSPAIFGGSNSDAIKFYLKAIKLFDQQPEMKDRNWHYMHALISLGQVYEETGQKEKAIAIYKKAIAIDSRFKLVKEELLPGVR